MRLLIAALCALVTADDPSKRLNPAADYFIANPQPGHAARGFTGEYFEVDAPSFSSRYGEVVWDMLPDVQLPKELVARFDGKVMSVTGHEVNVLRKAADGKEESVPCYDSYNHHYVAYLRGRGADVTRHNPSPSEAPPIQLSHPHPVTFHSNDKDEEAASVGFAAMAFSEHNGNEARQTYHGLPAASGGKQYVVAMASPTHFSFGPMQINTRRPDGSGKRCRGGDPMCPLPKNQNSRAGDPWSGILVPVHRPRGQGVRRPLHAGGRHLRRLGRVQRLGVL